MPDGFDRLVEGDKEPVVIELFDRNNRFTNAPLRTTQPDNDDLRQHDHVAVLGMLPSYSHSVRQEKDFVK